MLEGSFSTESRDCPRRATERASVHPQPCAVSLVFVVSSGTPNNIIGMTASARHNKRRAFVCIRDKGRDEPRRSPSRSPLGAWKR